MSAASIASESRRAEQERQRAAEAEQRANGWRRGCGNWASIRTSSHAR